MRICKKFPQLFLMISLMLSIGIGFIQDQIKTLSTVILTGSFSFGHSIDPLRITLASGLINFILIVCVGFIIYAVSVLFALKRPKRRPRSAPVYKLRPKTEPHKLAA